MTSRRRLTTLCRQCDMHCGIEVTVEDGRISAIRGNPGHPQTRGRVCPKAPAAVELTTDAGRLRRPLKRRADGTFAEVSHARAMAEIAATLRAVRQKDGARAVGVWTGEAVGFQQQADYGRRFAHAFGSPNYFSAESVCFASRYIAYRLVQGFYNPCADFARAHLIVLWGMNPGISHLPYMLAIRAARAQGARLVVIDPRRSEAAREADLFIQLRPGTDGALAWGLARRLIVSGGIDHDFIQHHTTGFSRFSAYAENFAPETVENQTGVPRDTLDTLAAWIADRRPRVIHAPGISLEHQVNGVNTIRVIASLAGLSGSVDVEGGETWPEPPPLRRLPLYDELPLAHEQPVGADRFPVLYHLRRECHSLSAMDRMLGDGAYPLRALIVTGANPVLTNPNSAKVVRALQSLDLLVVRDLFMTPTARLAHYVLPAASFLERSELHCFEHAQRLALSTRILDPSPATDEYTFWRELALEFGLAERYFPWPDETAVNRWLLEPTGISLEQLQQHPEGLPYAPYRPHKHHRRPLPTASGKFEFASAYLRDLGYEEVPPYLPPAHVEARDPHFPFVLITGARKSFFYHSRYRNIARFRRAVPLPEVEIHPADAAGLGVRTGDRVRIASAVGSLEIAARVTGQEAILPGVLQVTHGWEEANVNLLTDDRRVDPISGLPDMKTVPVNLSKSGNGKPYTET